jgi:hypothetical protein
MLAVLVRAIVLLVTVVIVVLAVVLLVAVIDAHVVISPHAAACSLTVLVLLGKRSRAVQLAHVAAHDRVLGLGWVGIAHNYVLRLSRCANHQVVTESDHVPIDAAFARREGRSPRREADHVPVVVAVAMRCIGRLLARHVAN